MERVDYDDLTKKLGQFGKYQRTVFFLISFSGFPFAFNNMGIVFIGASPNHWCTSPELTNLSLSEEDLRAVTIPLEKKDGEWVYRSCKRYNRTYQDLSLDDLWSADRNQSELEKCRNGWDYDHSTYESSIVTQCDLVCEDRWLQATAASVYMAGLCVGVIVMSSISDLLGRKPTYIVSLVGSIVFAFTISFSPNFIAFSILRFLTGFFSAAVYTVGLVLAMEIVGPDYRMHVGMGMNYYWAVGYLAYALVAYFIRDWYTLNLVATGCLIPILLVIIILPESPRWLYVKGKKEQADLIIHKAAKWNKVELPAKLIVDVKQGQKRFVWDMFRRPRMACRSFNVAFNWLVNSMVYYGLSLNTSNLGGNDYVNFAISAGLEIPATLFSEVCLHYLGRRIPLCFTMILAGVALLLTLAVPTNMNWLIITLAMIGKFGITASFVIMYVFTAEMYPTTMRNIAVGYGSFFARIGGVIAPYIGQLSDFSKFIPLIVFGVTSIVAGFLGLAFPESRGKHMPETLEDGDNFGKEKTVNENGAVEGKENPVFALQDEFTKL